jgi:two-component sensor histidine kinase
MNLSTVRVPGSASDDGARLPASATGDGPVPTLGGDAIDLLPVAALVVDADGRVLRFNRRAAELWSGPPPAQLPLPPDGAPVRDHEIALTRSDGAALVALLSANPLRDADGRLASAVVCLTDITERRAAEQRQRLLLDELGHRVKNTLATVQALAAQTVRGAGVQGAWRETFEARLIALSKAHDLLTRRSWESAALVELLASELAPWREPDAARIVLDGPPVTLAPRAALTLGMVVHELATNALKHGALSQPGGTVAVRWRLVPGAAPDAPPLGESRTPRLAIDWVEQGGPPVRAPRRRGFGSRLVLRGVATDLDGTAALDFDPAGVRCRMEFPVKPPRGRDGRPRA